MKKYNITTLILMEIPIMSRIEYSGFIVMLISCTILILNIALISAFKSKYNSLPNMVLSVALSIICILYSCFANLSKYSCFFTFVSVVFFILNILIEFILRKTIHKAFKTILQKHCNVQSNSLFYITNKEIYIAYNSKLFVLDLTDNNEGDTIFEKDTESSHKKILHLINRRYYFRLF